MSYRDYKTGRIYSNIPKGYTIPLIVKGQPVTEEAHDNYYEQNPKQLSDIEVYPEPDEFNPRDTEQNLKYRRQTEEADALTAKTSEFDKLGNPFSLANHINAGIKYFKDGSPYWSTVWNGGSGIFPDYIAQEYPRATAFSNFMFDLTTPIVVNKTVGYLSQPIEYPTGAETFRVWSPNPLSSKIFKEVPKDFDAVSKNAVPESIPLKYEFESLEGNPVYSQKKMVIPKKLNPKKLSHMYQRAANKYFFPNQVEGETMIDLISPRLDKTVAVTDIMQGNIGYPRFTLGLGRYGIVDSSGIMSMPNYQFITAYRKGGKLWD